MSKITQLRAAEAKATKGPLVSLSAVLRHKEACRPSLEWLASAQCATFAEAYAACPDVHWLMWLAEEVNSDEEFAIFKKHGGTGGDYRRDLIAAFPASRVERFLYAYAVKHGLAPLAEATKREEPRR